MDAKKTKMCKVRLRRLRPELMDKLKTKRIMARADAQFSSSSSESEDDETEVVEKISVQLKSPLVLSSNNTLNPFVLLTETEQALTVSTAKGENATAEEKMDTENSATNTTTSVTASSFEKSTKKTKYSKQKSHYYTPSPLDGGRQRRSKLAPPLESDSIYYHSDGEGPCSYNCNHMRTSGAKALSSSPTRRSSTGSSSSLLSDKCSMHFSKLFDSNCISVMDDENPPTALSKILSIKEFDPLAPQQLVALIIKSIVSLAELSQREDNIINVDIGKRRLLEITTMSQEGKKTCRLNPFMDVSDIVVTHPDDEFFTICLCKNCEEYRELVIHIMVEQFKAAHMVVMLLDVLIKAYGPMLKNITAYNKFEKLLDSNKQIYWITCGVIYHKKGEHLDFIYDEYLSDNMIFVLFSSILMLNNPLLLLQILAFHVECIVKAYAEGFLEIVEPDQSKIPADEMINYILNGYDDLIRISDQVASYLFAFENDFLRKFSLTWKLLCQRLYQQHLHLHLADTMLACIITLKEEELTSNHTDLIKRYIQFDDVMNYVEKRWTDVWIELNKFNLSEVERKRRKSLLDVYRIFDTVVQDAIAFSLQDSVDDNDFYDFRSLKNRRLAWKNIMSYTKMKWPDGFYQPPNTLVVDDKCKTCNVSLDYHAEYCKCITCSIASGPLPPKRNADGKCSKCLAHEIVEKDVNFYDSKIVNVCANDDFQNFMKNNNGTKRKTTALQEVGQELYSNLASVEEMLSDNNMNLGQQQPSPSTQNVYHISWAVFNHLNNRKRFPSSTIEKDNFCHQCTLASCRLARKILNNKISPSLSQDLIHYYQPMSMSREELRSILPNIMLYNRKLVASNIGLDLIDVHDLVVKIYWIFIISVYAIYFIDFEDGPERGLESALNLDALELKNNDISVNVEKIVGNKDDTKFLEFLDKIKSFDAVINIDSAEIQKKLNDILNISDNHEPSAACENIPPPVDAPAEDQQAGSELNSPDTVDSQPKKGCKDKSKKCCFDHSDLGDHCKENHTNKKRLKKDCNHVRMNETRDRLRKKLSQIVNARKNSKTIPMPTSTAMGTTESQSQMENVLKAHELKLFQQFQQQLPHSASWDPHTIAATFEQMQESKRNEKLHDLCECLQHIQTGSQKSDAAAKLPHKKNHHKQMPQKVPEQISLEPPNKKSNISNNSTRDASTSSQSAKSKERNNEPMQPETPTAKADPNPQPPTTLTTSTTTSASTVSKASNNLDYLIEICEIIDNYSKEQAKRKWIKETLSFIEGPATAAGKKKSQPQTSNPKKAAKKAKQKQRKEEEKRIGELQDLRGQFHNIYFKEFSEKHNLKTLKTGKKRDKKKISELENNIKNLQRAKAKVETAILELIATVKQTNSEFKFSYLPTKEQQVEKVKELDGHNLELKDGSDNKSKSTNLHNAGENIVPSTPFTMTQTNNLNMVPETYSMPYAHANHFPYNLGFPPPAAPAPFGLMRATPMCYAPPPPGAAAVAQQQHLGQDVVAAMTVNATSNSHTDPSKRIVTIRRVNLPNVPEPQVTVTAKGSSPDKDKLLYTFINGQLVQTGTAPPNGAPQIPVITPVQPMGQSRPGHIAKLPPEHLLTIPPPPPPKLSKTQLKKERRRLAKIQAESDAAEDAERKRLEEEQQRIRVLEEQKLLELQQQQKQPKKKKKSAQPSQSRQSSCPTNKEIKSKLKQNKLATSNSTTSISTAENNEPLPPMPQMTMRHNAAKQQKRSVSTTTSCSAATSSSSNNSTSSQVNTRDNSVSSLKPANGRNFNSKKHIKEQKMTVSGNTVKSKANNSKIGISNKKPTPPTSSTESSEEEDEREKATASIFSHTSTQQQKSFKLNTLTQSCAKQKVIKVCQQKIVKSKTPPSSDTEDDIQNEKPQLTQKTKVSKKRRPKLVDNGQFDNNPFKSLHMQDSDTEWSSSEDDANHVGSELDMKMISHATANPQNSSTQISLPTQKNNTRPKKLFAQKDDQSAKKENDQDLKRNNSPDALQLQDLGVKRSTKQPPKGSINKLFKQQARDKSLTTPSSNSTKNNSSTFAQQQQQPEDCITKSVNQRTSKQESNGVHRKMKNENRLNVAQPSSQISKSNSTASVRINNGGLKTSCNKTQSRNSTRKESGRNQVQSSIDEVQNPQNSLSIIAGGNVENKNKRSQRNKKYQQKLQKSNQAQHQNCCSGIPNNMGYFNPKEVNVVPPTNSSVPPPNRSYQTLAEQMQALRLSSNINQTHALSAATQLQQRQHHIANNNVSIMDQLNRGVQVENLSLPPGITLTKVDPIKSEQLRQKSESIKKLAKPLQQPHPSQVAQAFHHATVGTTIIAPPVTPMSNYYNSPYIATGASITSAATLDPHSGIIMVEANPPTRNNSLVASIPTTSNSKPSKNKKRRNKSKANNNGPCPLVGNSAKTNQQDIDSVGAQPKMITLRNPMFHGGGSTPSSATIMQQPPLIQGRPIDGFPMTTAPPVDQPAAIIKNENGMYTIRNPALHQAVTNGLVLGGYRQFGNVNYYTPQEAAAEAARATMQQQQQIQAHDASKTSATSSSFSYFSNDISPANASHNNISISCTSIGGETSSISPQSGGGLTGDAAVIQRPTPSQKCISAIGSEVKSAQQQKQKSKEQHWSNFGSEKLPLNQSDNRPNTEGGSAVVIGGDLTLQEKYQQSKYYNGFEVFASSSGGSSSSATAGPHIHHSCGDDSPPPTISGYNSYLDGIPNTGVIRYDDASFLKNLIPGQNLNNEVSIHNVNDSNFVRNAQSPQAHRVEITPVYGGNRPQSTNLFDTNSGQANYRGNYREQLGDYSNDSNLFSNNNLHLNLGELESSMKYDFETPTSVANVTACDNHNSILDLNDILNSKNGPAGPASHRTSPYLDDNALEGFVQNMNSLRIASTAATADEQSSQLNGSGVGHPVTTSANASSNGWW